MGYRLLVAYSISLIVFEAEFGRLVPTTMIVLVAIGLLLGKFKTCCAVISVVLWLAGLWLYEEGYRRRTYWAAYLVAAILMVLEYLGLAPLEVV